MKSSTRTIRIKTKTTGRSPFKSTNTLRAHAIKNTSSSSRTKKNKTKKFIKSVLLSRSFQITVKTFLFLLLVSSFSYGTYALVGDSVAEDVIVSKSEIVKRVTELASLPVNDPQAVVRVEDAEKLQKQNDFYSTVKEGDYIVVYQDVAIIYDLRNDAIVGVKRSDR
ncbi:MAG: hypothetical protein QG653_112 [Patescibacteria group bacterium]|nr:hypothetical protein [Patescibacteria group bacterium]